jgi:hypothetical protein
MRNVFPERLTIEEMPTICGWKALRSACSRAKLPNVQSKTLVSTPSLRSWPARVAAPSGGKSISVAACVRK